MQYYNRTWDGRIAVIDGCGKYIWYFRPKHPVREPITKEDIKIWQKR